MCLHNKAVVTSQHFMKPITMNFYTVLFFVVISDKSCSASVCKSSKKLWSCTNGTATFNEDIFEKVRYIPGIYSIYLYQDIAF